MNRESVFAVGMAALLALSMLAMATPVLAQQGGGGGEAPFVIGEPRLEVQAPDATLTPGTTSEVNLQVSNRGSVSVGIPQSRDAVTAARNVRVEADASRPLEVETNQRAIGTVTENQPGQAPIAVTVPEGTEPGEYELQVELRYSYTSEIRGGQTQDRTRRVTRDVDVTVDDGPRFQVTDTSTDAQVGDRGTVETTLENVGDEAASDVRMTLSSQSSKLTFGQSSQETARAGALEPGESTTVSYDIAVSDDASVREFALDGTVQFDDSNGVPGVDESVSVGIQPQAKQRFALEDIESTLRVGEDGDLHGTVRNTGPTTAQSVVVQFADEKPNIVPIEREVAVGTLDPDETAEFRIPIEVTREAEAVPRTVDMAVRYRNAENELRVFEDANAFVELGEQRDEFLLDIDDRQLTAGSSTLLDVQVTNNLDETVTDVEAKVFTDGPLDSGDDEGYVESLDPGETVTVTFEVSAASTATPRTYPLQFDFRYDDARGNSKVSDTYRTAIDVTEAEDGGIPWLLVGGAVVLVVAGAYLYRRSQG